MIASFWCWESPLYEAVLALSVLITDRREFFPAKAIRKRGIGVVKHSHSEVHKLLPPLIPYTQVVIGFTCIPRAALKDVGLADNTLLMPMHDNSVQR